MAPNRAEVVTALIELVRDASGYGATVEVTDGSPSDPNREAIWVGDLLPVAAELAYWPADGTRQQRQDTYDVLFHHWAGLPGQSASEARARVEEMAGVTDDIIATQAIDIPNVQVAYVASWDGPNIEPSDEGYVGIETVAVRVEADYV